MRLCRVASHALVTVVRCDRRFVGARSTLSSEEQRYLDQEPPPRDLLVSLRTKDRSPTDDSEADVTVPGDSFGIMRNRVVFYKPVPRQLYTGELGDLFPEGCHPLRCVNPVTLRHLGDTLGVSFREATEAMQEAEMDINIAVDALCKHKSVTPPPGSFGLVGFESYASETFCLVDFSLPNFEATRDDEVLDAIHELTLSAAEMPLDTPTKDLTEKFINEWTVEDGRRCKDVLNEYNLGVRRIILLPHGDYSVEGFYVLHPVKEDTPNVGTGAAACCLDLRTGIHNRFRFHVERIADSLSEHVMQELVHYGQDVHFLRQAYWFRPEYSVEEYIRFKESLLQPSASIFELRYAVLAVGSHGLEGYRNLVEMEKLKIAQHKYEKHYEDFISPGKWLTSDNSQLQTVVSGSGNAPGTALHMHTNGPNTAQTAMETRTGPLRRTLESSVQAHGDYVYSRFYRNNSH
uniref:Uncharacterized protein n=1 Tax=Trypanosoma congolense (strain IL3000) TaxID=1068625 RepID=G0UU91_TRYCI|nr:conserved hypothetical protein [Trypanosoma congolense IL3000]